MKSAQYYIDKCASVGNCRLWSGAKSGYGYPVANIAGRDTFTYLHRYVYETFVGPISEGYVVDHTCNIRSCLNPNHLDVILPALNKIKEGTAGQKSKIEKEVVFAYRLAGFSQKKIASILDVSPSTISKYIKRNF